jgi:predicted N-acyltransferase
MQMDSPSVGADHATVQNIAEPLRFTWSSVKPTQSTPWSTQATLGMTRALQVATASSLAGGQIGLQWPRKPVIAVPGSLMAFCKRHRHTEYKFNHTTAPIYQARRR